MAKLNVMKAFMPLRTNRTSQATAVQVAHGSSFFAAACGPGVDIFRLDNIDKGVLYEKSFTMEYLGQLLQAQDGMTLALGVKFTSKPGIIVAAVLHLDTSMPKIELVLKDIKVDPTHGIEENIVIDKSLRRDKIGNTALRLYSVANGSFIFPEATVSDLCEDPPRLSSHPYDTLIVMCSRMDGGKVRWFDFADETLMHKRQCTGSFMASNSMCGIVMCEFSPCGKFMVSVDSKNVLRIWKFNRSRSPRGLFQPSFEIHTVLSSGSMLPKMVSTNNSSWNNVGNNRIAKSANAKDSNRNEGKGSLEFRPSSMSWIVVPSEDNMNKEFILCGGMNGTVLLWEIERAVKNSFSGSTRPSITIQEVHDSLKIYPNVHGKESIEQISHAILSDGKFVGETAWAVSFAPSAKFDSESSLVFWPFGKSNLGFSSAFDRSGYGNGRMISSISRNAKTPSKKSARKDLNGTPRPAFGVSTPTNRLRSPTNTKASVSGGKGRSGATKALKNNKECIAPSMRAVLSSHSVLIEGHAPRGFHVISTPGFTNSLADKIYNTCLQCNIPSVKNESHEELLNESLSSTIFVAVTNKGITITSISCVAEQGIGRTVNNDLLQSVELEDGNSIEIRPESSPVSSLKEYSYETNQSAWSKHDVGSFARRYRLPDVPNYDRERNKVGRLSKDHAERLIDLHSRVAAVESQLNDIKQSFHLFATDVNQQMATMLNLIKSIQ